LSKNTNTDKLKFRTPIVAVMGHVDHGKTTLLDTIREANVVDSEEGGITQNTRAHQVTTKSGHKITFIDTPGHEAFSAMRARGAEVTDFVLLVVAADDGLQAQSKQSIKFAKETNTPIIVAINKMDMPGADAARVKRELGVAGVNVEEYGGDVMAFEISALKKQGIDDLIEGIELMAEINELKSNPVRPGTLAQAYILESSLDKRIGAVGLCIVNAGEIAQRALGVTATDSFRVRAFLNEEQKPVTHIHESDPVWITGLTAPLPTGAIIYFVADEKAARTLQSELQAEIIAATTAAPAAPEASTGNDILLEMLAHRDAVKEGAEQKRLNIIVRASTLGTLEAVGHELKKLGDETRDVRIINSQVGSVSESDVQLAKTTRSIIVSFQQEPDKKVRALAKQQKVIIRNYGIIYEMMEELTGALEGLIEPEEQEVEIARARIKQIFTLSDGTVIAGCEIVKGLMIKGYPVYVERPSESTGDEIAEVGRGRISSLRQSKTEVREVKKGVECGIMISPAVAGMEAGDEIVAYKVE
jgi:translation initiation factor IF-2